MDVDKEAQSPSASDQRVLFLVNTFVIHSVRLLNNFAVICEDKLADVHRRILRADATLSLLEAKLRSVDGLEDLGDQIALDSLPDLALPPPAPESLSGTELSASSVVEPSLSSAVSTKSDLSRGNSLSSQNVAYPSADQPQVLKVKDDPKFTRFFRMLQVGVPNPAVKIQMSIEGFDPSILDDLNAAAPMP